MERLQTLHLALQEARSAFRKAERAYEETYEETKVWETSQVQQERLAAYRAAVWAYEAAWAAYREAAGE